MHWAEVCTRVEVSLQNLLDWFILTQSLWKQQKDKLNVSVQSNQRKRTWLLRLIYSHPFIHLDTGVPVLSKRGIRESVRQAELRSDPLQVLSKGQAAQEVDLTMGKPRLYPLLQELQNILKRKRTTETCRLGRWRYFSLHSESVNETHQSAGEADHSDGRLGRLGDVKQVVEQSLVLMVGEQVELVQDEQHRATAAAITWVVPEKPTCPTLHLPLTAWNLGNLI